MITKNDTFNPNLYKGKYNRAISINPGLALMSLSRTGHLTLTYLAMSELPSRQVILKMKKGFCRKF